MSKTLNTVSIYLPVVIQQKVPRNKHVQTNDLKKGSCLFVWYRFIVLENSESVELYEVSSWKKIPLKYSPVDCVAVSHSGRVLAYSAGRSLFGCISHCNI